MNTYVVIEFLKWAPFFTFFSNIIIQILILSFRVGYVSNNICSNLTLKFRL
jgi:hypothetical protein